MSISLSLLPSEVLVEIFKFNDWKIILTLSQVCKYWKQILEDDEFDFFKYLYNSYFNWRNNNLQFSFQNSNQNSFKNLFKKEIEFWNNWDFKNFKKFSVKRNKNLLEITKIETGDYYNYVYNKPLLYNSGVYYFEIKSLSDQAMNDNVFVGFLLKDNNQQEDHIGYLGSSYHSNSFGLYFSDGDIYGFDSNGLNKNYANCHIATNTIVGVYLDTNNLKVRFVLVFDDSKEKIFRLLNLNEFFTQNLMDSYCNGQLALYPAVSMLYGDDILELNTTAGFQSIEKANWIKNFLTKED